MNFRFNLRLLSIATSATTLSAQTLFVPGGASGISPVTNGTGNVGIGTASPAARLTVAGGGGYTGVLLGTESGGAFLRWSREGRSGDTDQLNIYDQDAGAVIAAFKSSGLTVFGNVGKSGSWTLGDSVWGANWLEVHTSSWDGVTNGAYGGVAAGHGYFYGGLQSGGASGGEAGAGQLWVSGASMLIGNVGIGTLSPAAKLDILAGTKQEIATYTPTAAAGISDFGVGGVGWTFARPNDGALAQAIYSYNSADGAKANLAISSRSDLVFAAGNAGPEAAPERMRIAENGNVGIGTTNPGTYKLAVVGKIRAQEIVVDTGWSDYVFEDSFKLKALSETEAFIKAEKHLPGIPSAQEVAEHGISVGEMQARLLAKIEELTLHVIAQEKVQSQQERRFHAQEQRIELLSCENRELRVQLNSTVSP